MVRCSISGASVLTSLYLLRHFRTQRLLLRFLFANKAFPFYFWAVRWCALNAHQKKHEPNWVVILWWKLTEVCMITKTLPFLLAAALGLSTSVMAQTTATSAKAKAVTTSKRQEICQNSEWLKVTRSFFRFTFGFSMNEQTVQLELILRTDAPEIEQRTTI